MNLISSNLSFISIIIPAYNVEDFIGEAVQSVINQSFQFWELLICDDSSTDNTLKILKSFDDPRVKVFSNSTNQGPGKTRDRLIRQASGQWIAVLDADDVYDPSRLEKFHQVAKKYPNSVIFDEIIECHDTTKGLVPWRTLREPDLLVGKHGSSSLLGKEISPAEWLRCESIMMKWMVPTDLIRNYNITHPDIRFGEDLDFIFRLLSATHATLWYVPQALYLYRLSAGSLTTSSTRFRDLASVFSEAKGYAGFSSDIVSALDSRVKKLEKRIIYQDFLTSLSRYKILDACVQAANQPWIIFEFMKRVLERIPYHVHRKIHNGSRRETI